LVVSETRFLLNVVLKLVLLVWGKTPEFVKRRPRFAKLL